MSDSIVTPAFQQVTPNNHGPWVVVTCYILLPLTVLVVFTRLVTRLQVARNLNLSDGLIVVSTILAMVQTICETLACNNGLGRHRNTLNKSSYDTYSKYFYSSEILLIATIAFAKASVTLLIVAIGPEKKVLLGCHLLLGVIALWAVAGIFALAFQCDLPRPWDSDPGRCINQHALLVVIGIFNILTDLVIILLSFLLMRNVQVSAVKRLQVVGLFATRIIVPIITILSLTTLTPYFSSSPPDKPWHAVAPAVYSQIMLNLSIITACIPSLKRFLQDLQSGAMAVNITEAFEMTGASSKKISSGQGGGGYAAMSGTTTNHSNFASRTASKFGIKRQPKSKLQTTTTTTTTGHNKDDDDHTADLKRGYEVGDGHSFSQGHNDNPHKFSTQRSTVERSESVKGLTDGVIYRSVDFKVEYEGRSSEGSGSRPSPPHEDATWYDTRNEEGDAISNYDIRK